MGLFTRPANVQKNVAATFVIDYAELAGNALVPAGYYKNTSNWKNVFVRVTHSSGQKNVIQYTLPSTEGTLLVSDTARAGVWEVDSIIIRDFDRGEVAIDKANIPSQSSFNFNVVSAASHGDLIVGAGQTLSIPANGLRQYGDLVVESGGTLEIADGGGIVELEVLGNCVINGTILAKQGKHMGGTWSRTSVLSEALVHAITQKAGGAGGTGEGLAGGTETHDLAGAGRFNTTTMAYYRSSNPYDGAGGEIMTDAQYDSIVPGQTAVIRGYFLSTTNLQTMADATVTVVSKGIYNASFYTVTYAEDISPYGQNHLIRYVFASSVPGGVGGAAAFGNGGGGGRSGKFVGLNGGDAIDITAGVGAGAFTSADEYGEAGSASAIPSEAAGGGFRGAHGQAIYIKATRIQGTGTIDASGQKGGDGGAGAEFLSEGQLYANGAGGGAAGGDGGKVWLRTKKGTPSLNVIVSAGEKGSRGESFPGAVNAEHGIVGAIGAYSFANY